MKTAVVGGSGYAGGELLRLLAHHPKFEVSTISAGVNAGELITAIHPQLQSYAGLKFSTLEIADLNNCEMIFLALPHGESSKLIKLLNPDTKIVDLGADYRLISKQQWEKYYSGDYAGSLPYGLPELADKEIYRTNRIANPGCYATAISLGAAPLINIPQVDVSDLVVVAASGTTGAGRSSKIHLLGSEVMANLTSYKFAGAHQHTPEIEQQLSVIAGKEIKLSFTPILAPMPRGILATINCKYSGSLDIEHARAIFTEKYAKSSFVHLLEKGAMPNTSAVTGSNHVHIQVGVDSHASRVIVSVAIDNLGKGAAGQAIQNANLMIGLPENSGLEIEGVK